MTSEIWSKPSHYKQMHNRVRNIMKQPHLRNKKVLLYSGGLDSFVVNFLEKPEHLKSSLGRGGKDQDILKAVELYGGK